MLDELPPHAPALTALDRLLDRLETQHGLVRLDAAGFEQFAAGPGDRVVLFAEDPVRVAETWDVAVVLPEVLKEVGRRIAAGVLDPASAHALAPHYGVRTWPALLFLRDGGYVGALEGMRDWDVYLREVASMLDRPAGRAPGVGVAVHAEAPADSCRWGAP